MCYAPQESSRDIPLVTCPRVRGPPIRDMRNCKCVSARSGATTREPAIAPGVSATRSYCVGATYARQRPSRPGARAFLAKVPVFFQPTSSRSLAPSLLLTLPSSLWLFPSLSLNLSCKCQIQDLNPSPLPPSPHLTLTACIYISEQKEEVFQRKRERLRRRAFDGRCTRPCSVKLLYNR